MSTPRYPWWSYVKNIIRRHPELKREYAALHEQGVTPSYEGMPGGGGEGRPLEEVVARQLPPVRQREYDAVEAAIQATKKLPNGAARLAVIRYIFWSGHRGRRLLSEAARRVHYSCDAVKGFHHDFIMLVAACYGLLDEEEK